MKKYLSIVAMFALLINGQTKSMAIEPSNLVVTKADTFGRDADGDEIQPNTQLGIIFTALKKYTGALTMLQLSRPGLTPTAKHNLRDQTGLGKVEISNNKAIITNTEGQTCTISLPQLVAANKNYALFKAGKAKEFKMQRTELPSDEIEINTTTVLS